MGGGLHDGSGCANLLGSRTHGLGSLSARRRRRRRGQKSVPIGIGYCCWLLAADHEDDDHEDDDDEDRRRGPTTLMIGVGGQLNRTSCRQFHILGAQELAFAAKQLGNEAA